MRGVVVCNPRAGRHAGAQGIDAAVDVLSAAGWSVDVAFTSAAGDATCLARAAVETGANAVLAAGGDGTLNEVIQALAGTDTAAGYIPYGTVNIWARELGIPLDPAGAARVFVEGKPKLVDLGRANGRYFLLMAGLGFDGEIVRRERSFDRYKQRFGVLPYVAAGLSTAWQYRGADVELRYDGLTRRLEMLMMIVGNTRLYGGFLRFTPRAIANDGWLDVCIIKGRGPLALVRRSLPLVLARTARYADVERLRVRELSVRAARALPLQIDGELADTTPVAFAIAPKVLRVIVPHTFVSDLIA